MVFLVGQVSTSEVKFLITSRLYNRTINYERSFYLSLLRAQPERPLDEQIEFNSKATIKSLPLLLGYLWHIPIIKLAFSVRQDRKYYTIAAQ